MVTMGTLLCQVDAVSLVHAVTTSIHLTSATVTGSPAGVSLACLTPLASVVSAVRLVTMVMLLPEIAQVNLFFFVRIIKVFTISFSFVLNKAFLFENLFLLYCG